MRNSIISLNKYFSILIDHKEENVENFAKIGKPEEENIKNDLEDLEISYDNLSPIHYLSWLSGILLSCFYIASITFVPLHNTLCEPQYFWEFMLFAAFGWVSTFNATLFIGTRYWANLHPGPWMTPFIGTMIASSAFNIVFTISYYYIWVDFYGFYAPMPLAYYLPGTYTGFLSFFLCWFRYIRVYSLKEDFVCITGYSLPTQSSYNI